MLQIMIPDTPEDITVSRICRMPASGTNPSSPMKYGFRFRVFSRPFMILLKLTDSGE